MMRLFKKIPYIVLTSVILSSTTCHLAYSLESKDISPNYMMDQNIYYYSPGSQYQDCSASGGIGASSLDIKLPEETIKKIRDFNIDAKLAKTKDRYLYAEKATKVPWQLLAAVHYREGSMNPNTTIQDGSPLRDGVTVDNQKKYADPNKDAEEAAKHIIEMGKMVYSVDPSKDRTLEALANSLLAYNRGFLYKKAGATYDTSPYVMNGLDDKHMNMSWGNGDTVSGKDANLGALVIYTYLTSDGTYATGSVDPSGCTSGAVPSGECKATKPVFGASGGNGHQLTKDELTKLYGTYGKAQESSGNLVSVDFLDKKLRVHKKVAGCLSAVANEIKTKGIQYNIKEIGGWRVEKGGGNVEDGSSYHQYGVAIDINWSDNPCCSVSSYTMPAGYIEAFRNHGWSWGGDWKSIKDYMHFEYNGPME